MAEAHSHSSSWAYTGAYNRPFRVYERVRPTTQRRGKGDHGRGWSCWQAHRESARATVKQMFPQVEGDVIDMVLEANNGDLGSTIEAMIDIVGGLRVHVFFLHGGRGPGPCVAPCEVSFKYVVFVLLFRGKVG